MDINQIMYDFGFELQYTVSPNTSTERRVYMQRDFFRRAQVGLVSIHCEVDLQGNFTFVYVTNKHGFRLSSGEFGTIENKEHFERNLIKFRKYAQTLYNLEAGLL